VSPAASRLHLFLKDSLQPDLRVTEDPFLGFICEEQFGLDVVNVHRKDGVRQ